MKANKTTRPKAITPQELNQMLILRGLKALEKGTMKVTVAGYLRLQRSIPSPPVQIKPPVWIEN